MQPCLQPCLILEGTKLGLRDEPILERAVKLSDVVSDDVNAPIDLGLQTVDPRVQLVIKLVKLRVDRCDLVLDHLLGLVC